MTGISLKNAATHASSDGYYCPVGTKAVSLHRNQLKK